MSGTVLNLRSFVRLCKILPYVIPAHGNACAGVMATAGDG